MPIDSYKHYKKSVKKAGGKEIATPAQYKLIQQRIREKYGRPDKTVRQSVLEKALRTALSQKEINKFYGDK